MGGYEKRGMADETKKHTNFLKETSWKMVKLKKN
jgi:hypothetical protein